jgi:hypothetical protein
MAKISNLDFYAILGVHPNAEDIVIRAAFKALAQRYHPDRFNGSKDEAHRRMADLTSAYETLADPARRRKYDRRRGLSGRQARFYFKNPERERHPPFTAFALRAAARKAQYYRNAVYVLMVVVVILSAFNVHQHAAQIREIFAWNRPASGAISAATPNAGAISGATPHGDARMPTPAAPNAEAEPTTTTTNVRVLPVGPGTTRPIIPSVPEAQTPAAPASDTAAAAPPVVSPALASPAASSPAPSSPIAAPAIAAPTVAAPSVAAPASPPPPDTPHAPARTATAEPQKAAAAAPKDAKRAAPAKPVAAKAAEPERPARPSTPEGDRCTPELVALGLCNRSSTAKGQ